MTQSILRDGVRLGVAALLLLCCGVGPVTADSGQTSSDAVGFPSVMRNEATGDLKPALPDPYIPHAAVIYPPIARRLQQEGVVQLDILIQEDGFVRDAKIHRSSGFPQLD